MSVQPTDSTAPPGGTLWRQWFLGLLFAAVVTLQVPLPVKLVGLTFALGAVVTGIVALVELTSGGRPRRSPATLVHVGGLAVAGLLSITYLGMIVTYPLQSDLENCLRGANTLTAREGCTSNYEDRVDSLRNAFSR